MSRSRQPRIGWGELAVFVLLYIIALGFSALAVDNPFGIAVLVVTLLMGAATVFLILRTKERR